MISTEFNLLTVKTETVSDCKVIKLNGLLNQNVKRRFLSACIKALKSETKKFIFDLSGIIKLSVWAVNLLAEIAKKIEEMNGSMVLLNTNTNLNSAMNQIKRLSNEINIFNNEGEIKNYISSSDKLYCF